MKKTKKLTHMQIIALGFLCMIAAGTLLLCLPVSTRGGGGTDFLTALFTATSASCVTGLVLQDTATYWSLFGQLVIIILIQIGGLGFMTIAVTLIRMLNRRTGLRERAVMAESINANQIGGMSRLTGHIIIGTVILETGGAALLAIRFVPQFGLWKGIYYGFFHAVSAFCNAGFDLMGYSSGRFASFSAYSDDLLVNAVLMVLIVCGGLGFLVWDDLLRKHFRFQKLRLHTKIVLLATALLLFGGALLLWIFERNDTAAGLSVKETVLTSLFGSVTARTAGFNTTDTGALSDSGKLLTMLLMFIGGSSGSTAGGVKTTTIAVVLMTFYASVRGHRYPHCFERRLDDSAVKKAVTIICVNLFLALLGTMIICTINDISLSDALFETFSAIGTVGMTTGITRDLTTVSRLVIIFLMYCGRVGSISFAAAVFVKRSPPSVTYPTEEITVG